MFFQLSQILRLLVLCLSHSIYYHFTNFIADYYMAYYIFLYLLSRLIYSCAVWGRGGRNLISQAFVFFFLGFFANNLFLFFFLWFLCQFLQIVVVLYVIMATKQHNRKRIVLGPGSLLNVYRFCMYKSLDYYIKGI